MYDNPYAFILEPKNHIGLLLLLSLKFYTYIMQRKQYLNKDIKTSHPTFRGKSTAYTKVTNIMSSRSKISYILISCVSLFCKIFTYMLFSKSLFNESFVNIKNNQYFICLSSRFNSRQETTRCRRILQQHPQITFSGQQFLRDTSYEKRERTFRLWHYVNSKEQKFFHGMHTLSCYD